MARYIDTDQFEVFSFTDREGSFSDGVQWFLEYIDALPSADVQPVRHDSCDVCDGLEDGDTLYIHSEWDGGIGFDYIHDIHFCPKCGRRLPNFENRKDGEEGEKR